MTAVTPHGLRAGARRRRPPSLALFTRIRSNTRERFAGARLTPGETPATADPGPGTDAPAGWLGGISSGSMAWIETIDEDEAEGRLAKLYKRLREPWGGVDNIFKIHSLNPPSARGHLELYRALMRGRSPLSTVQREMIAVVVSSANRCHY